MSGLVYILDGRIYSCDVLGHRDALNIAAPDMKYPHASVYCGVLFPVDYDSFIIKSWMVDGFDGIAMVEGHSYKGVIIAKNTLIEISLFKGKTQTTAQVNHIPIEPDMRYCLSNNDDVTKIMTIALMSYESVEKTEEAIKNVRNKFHVLSRMDDGCNADVLKMASYAKDDPNLLFISPDVMRSIKK